MWVSNLQPQSMTLIHYSMEAKPFRFSAPYLLMPTVQLAIVKSFLAHFPVVHWVIQGQSLVSICPQQYRSISWHAVPMDLLLKPMSTEPLPSRQQLNTQPGRNLKWALDSQIEEILKFYVNIDGKVWILFITVVINSTVINSIHTKILMLFT